MLKDYQKKMLGLFVAMKEQLADLYSVFAESFPEYALFWSDMADGVREHSDWLAELTSELEKNTLSFDEGSTKTYTVRAFIEYLRDIKTKTQRKEITVLNALSLTVDIEKSLMVREMFDRFSAKSPAGEQKLLQMKKKICRHVEKAEKELRAFTH